MSESVPAVFSAEGFEMVSPLCCLPLAVAAWAHMLSSRLFVPVCPQHCHFLGAGWCCGWGVGQRSLTARGGKELRRDY